MSSEAPSDNLDPNLWYLKGEPYDFTSFVPRHPGGEKAIGLGKGRDCTALFQSYHTILPAQELLDKYRHDRAAPKQSHTGYEFTESGFYRTLKSRAENYFSSNGLHHTKGSLVDFFWYFCNMTGFLALYYLAFIRGSAIAALLVGPAKSLLVIRSTHAASHYSLSTSPLFNRFVYWFNMCFCGDTPAQWTAKHVVAHHIDTNIVPHDDDTMYPIKRVLPKYERCWWHNYQHLYIWVLYFFIYYPWTISHNIKLLISLFTGQTCYEGTAVVRHENLLDWVESLSAMSVQHLTRFLPFICLPWRNALVVSLLAEFTGSMWFSLQFAVNHETPEATVLSTNDKEMLDKSRDWGAHQLVTSHNYGVDSWWSLHMSGGLNYQIEHHLFPSVHYKHYPALSLLVRQLAKEFKLPYNATPTFFEAVVNHYSLLKTMGGED